MHQSFSRVLGQRDSSRAGDSFSLEDTEIEDCSSEASDQIKDISCSADYLTNDNDQAVVEICITRITTAIRETGSIERHSMALVALWESCLEHNLTPEGESTEDTPHAKIASDITSCISQNYSCPSVMASAVPVAVRFSQRGNQESSRNMSSYLSSAAIAKADLSAEHTEAITASVSGGNHMMLRVSPSVYLKQPDTIHHHSGSLTAMMPQSEPPEQQHSIRLIQMVADQHPLMLSTHVPTSVSHSSDHTSTEALLGALVDVSQASPSSSVSFLPALRMVGQQSPAFLSHVAKLHGAIGILSENHAHSSLVYLVSLLGSMEHSFHHTLSQEIRASTDRYPSLLGGCGRDIYRMSNSFTAIARVSERRSEDKTTGHCRADEACQSLHGSFPSGRGGGTSDQRSQTKVHNSDTKTCNVGTTEVEEVEEESPASQRRHSSSQGVRQERRDMRFNRSKSLALHVVGSHSINCDTAEDSEAVEPSTDKCLSYSSSNQHSESREVSLAEKESTGDDSWSVTGQRKEAEKAESKDENREEAEQEEADRLFIHLRDNMEKIREFCKDMVKSIPVPEQCVIEADSSRGCVAKLSFSCPSKGYYCSYAKSSFHSMSQQPHLWIHIMSLHLQSKSSVTSCTRDKSVERLASLWEKTHLKGSHSFSMAMTQQTTPQRKDSDNLHIQLEEVRFFDSFGYSEEEGGWLCFMCNNPEKATVVNQEGQPSIEGKSKEKQVRWKFIKRWKTRYFTLAGNQLLFRRGKFKDESGDIPIESSKVQSVKVVAKKRRDRGSPRAFEIFTDSKTYVSKAEDEKHAEEWSRCINVAVAQARERENREATTYS